MKPNTHEIVIMKKSITTFLFIIFSFVSVVAQDSLTLEQAVELALKNNYAISIARSQAAIANNNNNIGNAGFLPSLAINASTSSSNNITTQDYFTGTSINKTSAISSILNSGAALNWTIFDGLKMFATKAKLEELEEQGMIHLKIEIENTIVKITTAYFDVVRQQQLIKAIKDAIEINKERVNLAQLRFDIGSISKMDLLLAKVDLNTQKSLLFKQNSELNNAKTTLNQLLSKSVSSDFMAKDNIIVDYKPVYADLQKMVNNKNNQLLSAQKNIAIANSSLKEQNSLRLPNVDLNATYNFSQIKNQVGLVLLNKNLGLNTGITASWTLFNGFRYNTHIKSARYLVEQNKLEFQQLNSQLESSLLKAFVTYTNLLEMLKLEEENAGVAKESVSYALERFEIGNNNTIELMTAQKNYQDALSRLIAARYEAKLSETELKRLEGALVK
jgi:outer membrane protein